MLDAASDALGDVEPWQTEAIETALRGLAERLELKPRAAFGPVRIALTGRTVAPGLFESAFRRAETILSSLGVPLIPVVTNVRHIEHAWDDMMSAGVASCLALLQSQARTGLVPAEFAYHLVPRWGAHPLTDPLLSSDSFRIVHDGAGFTRPEKIETIADWPEALANLRVCWAGTHRDRNCGRCSKCVRTIMAFRAVGLPLPPCFEHDVTNRQIRALGRLDRAEQRTQRALLDTVAERGVQGSWVRAARSLYYRSRRRDLIDLAVGHVRRRA